jgi:hypothetical protein
MPASVALDFTDQLTDRLRSPPPSWRRTGAARPRGFPGRHATHHVASVAGGIAFFVALVSIAGLIEIAYYPDRWRPLLESFGLEMFSASSASSRSTGSACDATSSPSSWW